MHAAMVRFLFIAQFAPCALLENVESVKDIWWS